MARTDNPRPEQKLAHRTAGARNVQKLKSGDNPRPKKGPRGSDLFLEQRIVAEIDHQRVTAPLEPAIEGVQVTPPRPGRGKAVPAIQLRLENLVAHFFEILADFFLVLTLRRQVDLRLTPEIFQTQATTRRICPV